MSLEEPEGSKGGLGPLKSECEVTEVLCVSSWSLDNGTILRGYGTFGICTLAGKTQITRVTFGGCAHLQFWSKGLCFLIHKDVEKPHVQLSVSTLLKISLGRVCLVHSEEGAAHHDG